LTHLLLALLFYKNNINRLTLRRLRQRGRSVLPNRIPVWLINDRELHPNTPSLYRLQSNIRHLNQKRGQSEYVRAQLLYKIYTSYEGTQRTVLCCVEMQNHCSEYFETPQGLRQVVVLSTPFFNFVMEVIVRRANILTRGAIFDNQIQL
jgi:hypothetical protein